MKKISIAYNTDSGLLHAGILSGRIFLQHISDGLLAGQAEFNIHRIRLGCHDLAGGACHQIHDELIVEAEESVAKEAGKILEQEMEHAAELLVPLLVDIHRGRDWYTAKG